MPDPPRSALPLRCVAVLGHRGLGKSALAVALGASLGRADSRCVGALPGEVARLRMYRTNYLEYETHGFRYRHIDAAGDPVGAAWSALSLRMAAPDTAVVVVSATRAVEDGTLDHLIAARGAGVARFVVLLVGGPATGADRVDACERDVREWLDHCGVAGDEVPVVRAAAPHDWAAATLEALAAALDAWGPAPARPSRLFAAPVPVAFACAVCRAPVTGRLEEVVLGEPPPASATASLIPRAGFAAVTASGVRRLGAARAREFGVGMVAMHPADWWYPVVGRNGGAALKCTRSHPVARYRLWDDAIDHLEFDPEDVVPVFDGGA